MSWYSKPVLTRELRGGCRARGIRRASAENDVTEGARGMTSQGGGNIIRCGGREIKSQEMTSLNARKGKMASQEMTSLNAGEGDEITGNDVTKCGIRGERSAEWGPPLSTYHLFSTSYCTILLSFLPPVVFFSLTFYFFDMFYPSRF